MGILRAFVAEGMGADDTPERPESELSFRSSKDLHWECRMRGKGGGLEYRVEIPRRIWGWALQDSKTRIQVFKIGWQAGRKRGNKETKDLEQTVDYCARVSCQ